MSIAKFAVIQCDVESCGFKTPMLDFNDESSGCEDIEEAVRADQGFSFVDAPFKKDKDLYICKKCFTKIFGKNPE